MVFAACTVASAQYPVHGDAKKPAGRIKSFTEQCYDTSNKNKTLVVKRKYEYNASGKLLRCIIYDTIDSMVVEDTVTYKYEDQQLFEEVGKNYKARYLYDERGSVIAKKVRSPNLNFLNRNIYNQDNLLVETISYSPNNHLVSRDNFKYDDSKHLLIHQHTVTDTLDKSFRAVYTSDLYGNPFASRVYAVTSYLLYSSKFWYGDDNLLRSETRYNSSGSFLERKEYAYIKDARGNWISLKNKNKNSSYLTTRKIEYQ